jgi:hypothetical protein
MLQIIFLELMLYNACTRPNLKHTEIQEAELNLHYYAFLLYNLAEMCIFEV